MSAEPCPLCGGAPRPFFNVDGRGYLRCDVCLLTFVPASQHSDAAREKARYAKHNNKPDDPGYRQFLERLLIPLSAVLSSGAEGLDYGCGPGPTASGLMRERGFVMFDYDPYFFPDRGALSRAYDFIVSTEVIEHLRRPIDDLTRLDALLKPGGVLGVMTGVLEDDAAFPAWWYRNDFTHITFYRPETLSWIADRFGWGLTRPTRDVALFRKPARELV